MDLETDPVIGYRACWQDHGDGKHCRMPVGHPDWDELMKQLIPCQTHYYAKPGCPYMHAEDTSDAD